MPMVSVHAQRSMAHSFVLAHVDGNDTCLGLWSNHQFGRLSDSCKSPTLGLVGFERVEEADSRNFARLVIIRTSTLIRSEIPCGNCRRFPGSCWLCYCQPSSSGNNPVWFDPWYREFGGNGVGFTLHSLLISEDPRRYIGWRGLAQSLTFTPIPTHPVYLQFWNLLPVIL